MPANKLWNMRVTDDDKATIQRVASRLQTTETDAIKKLVRAADEILTRSQEPARMEPAPEM